MARPSLALILVFATLGGAAPIDGRYPSALTALGTGPSEAPAGDAVPPPTGLTVVAKQGRTVTFGWTPPTGIAPSAYVLEGGLHPGEVLASLPIGGAAVSFIVDAPMGALYVRLHAVAAEARSAASNEVLVFIDVPAPPSPPAHLLGTVDGSTVALSWTNTYAGGTPTQLWLEVSGSVAALLPVPWGETFSYDAVPSGAYELRLIASNASGASEPSNALSLAFPSACSGPPGPPVNFQAWTSDTQLFVSWSPPTSGPAVASYTVFVNGTLTLAVDTTARTISGTLPQGEYAISVVARNSCGESPAAPAATEWTTVVKRGNTDLVHWLAAPGASGYRVYWSTNRQALETLDITAPYVEAQNSPAALPTMDASAPLYYRVYGTYGPVVGSGGPVAAVPGFSVVDHADWAAAVTPALWDVNGDGCLDLVGGWGNCDGSFTPYALSSVGLEALALAGQAHKDSRFADFTGDGLTDIFTNVYQRADDPSHAAVLHVGQPDGRFIEDPAVTAMNIRGFGETILAADFDNDGDLDIFLPQYTDRGDGGHNWLLINDGSGHFVDVAGAAGVAINAHFPPEAAQALDFDQDGWVDIHVGSQLFINNGDLTFTDRAADFGLPVRFDEGMRLFDVDLDGDFDLVHHDSNVTRLYRNDGGTFDSGSEVGGDATGATIGFGLNICDVNGDGFEDVLVASNDVLTGTGRPQLLTNVGGALVASDLTLATPVYNDLLACADLDGSGLPDVVGRWTEVVQDPSGGPVPLGRFRTYVTQGTAAATIRLRVVGAGGERNQQGRVVHVRPLGAGGRSMVRTVESGSGYLAQNGYDLLVAAPWPGEYEVSVRFADGWVRTTARPGDELTIRADGSVISGLQ